MKPIAFITGATSGIGEATARVLAKRFSLIICGRRSDRLQNLTKELSKETEVISLEFDVRDKEAVYAKISSLPKKWTTIDVLINNAGNAHGLSLIHEGDDADWDDMIDINVKGLLYVSKAIVPEMVKRKKGHIINIGSIAGVDVYPRGNVYNASKFAVDALTKGMRMDLNAYGIKVSEIKPGMVETEFSLVRFKGDKEKSALVYQNIEALQATDIAETIEFMITRPAHVNIADVLILPTAQASASILNRQVK